MDKILSALKLLAISLAVILAPIEGAAATAFILCLTDMFTGILAAKKQSIPITSSGLKRTIAKLVVYEAAIVLTFIVDKYLTGPVPLSNIVSGLIGITELKSCLENINIVGGGDVLKSIITALTSETPPNAP